ncbi:hypothetical protein [Octadecabacter arcticus]|uniref:hypothetical protein n=1 Tax=Octadecabacter arcticus TaxID=53946 RepID=UPI0001809906|nr:hypothetical protein [Octadecabacter arcticus]
MAGSESLSGSWTGRFDYDNIALGTPVSFDAVLIETGSTLRGEVVEPNTFRAEATDTLLAVLTGTRKGSTVNGRVKVSQRSAQNVATLGLGQSAYRRAPASGQPRLSYSWRLPGCFGPSGPIYAD